MTTYASRISSAAKALGFDGIACIAILALAAWIGFHPLARDIETRWHLQLKLLYAGPPLVLYAALVAAAFLFWRVNRAPDDQHRRTRLAYVSITIALYLAILVATNDETRFFWLPLDGWTVSLSSAIGFTLLVFELWVLPVALIIGLPWLVMTNWREQRPGPRVRAVAFTVLLSLAFYVASGSYLMRIYGENYLEIHCNFHQPCK